MMRRWLASIFLLLLGSAVTAASPRPDYIEHSVETLVKAFSDGIAVSYPDFRSIQYGAIFGKKTRDAVAFFSIEGFGGSNYHAEYLAFYESVPLTQTNSLISHPYRLVAVAKIGGRGWRTFDWKSARITPLSVTVPGLEWQAQDPGCCASKPVTVMFRLEHERITERQQKQ